MPQAPRQVQHRARRDGRHARELADLKRERHQLEGERERLVLALEKSARPRKPRPIRTEPQSSEASVPVVKCPDCGESTRLVDLGRMKMRACPACKWHQKTE